MIKDQDILSSRILIIDDEPANVLLLEKLLHQEGYRFIQSITDPSLASQIYQDFEPDLILLDLNMPKVNGFQVMEILQELEKDSYLPVLILTAQNDKFTRLKALKKGAKDFVNKPFDLAEVCFRIKNILEVRLLHNQIKNQNKILEQKIQERTKELKESHEHLMHAEKLSAIGKLAASISHEFNNPILGIRNILEQISKTHLEKNLKELVRLAIHESNRVMDLATKLKNFYRPSSGKLTLVSFHNILDDMLILKKKSFLEKKIFLVKKYADDLPKVPAVEDQIKQVILNLLQNAEESIQNGNGEIELTTFFDGTFVEIKIQDNGCGIPLENVEKIFEPFYTTKDAVKGTGLGLSVTYGIVKRHGGKIICSSNPGKGTLFTLKFPVKRRIWGKLL